MAYRFKLGESFQKGLLRIGDEQILRAISQLDSSPPGVAVHETRKCMKRLRSLLRLVRSGIGETAFERENGRFRDIAGSLSFSRDRTVMLATLERLVRQNVKARPSLERVATYVGGIGDADGTDAGVIILDVRKALDDARSEWRKLSMEPDDFETIAEGLCDGMRRLKAAYRSLDQDDDETYHAWRKTTQRHWRHMRLVQAAWPSYCDARAAAAKHVSDILGRAQDLTLLSSHIRFAADQALSARHRKVVAGLAEKQRSEFRDLARRHGARLAAEGAKGLARRAHIYWDAAERLAEIDEFDQSAASDNEVLAGHGRPSKAAETDRAVRRHDPRDRGDQSKG